MKYQYYQVKFITYNTQLLPQNIKITNPYLISAKYAKITGYFLAMSP